MKKRMTPSIYLKTPEKIEKPSEGIHKYILVSCISIIILNQVCSSIMMGKESGQGVGRFSGGTEGINVDC
jgi:hypothetical protein